MLQDLDVVVEFAESKASSRTDQPYQVFGSDGGRLLLIDDMGRFAWIEAELLCPVSIARNDKKIFDRHMFLLKRSYEPYFEQQVLLTTWEDLGLTVDHRREDGMYVFRVLVEGFDGQLLMVRGESGERSGVLATQVYQIEAAEEDDKAD